jgi:hypothetical protein
MNKSTKRALLVSCCLVWGCIAGLALTTSAEVSLLGIAVAASVFTVALALAVTFSADEREE